MGRVAVALAAQLVGVAQKAGEGAGHVPVEVGGGGDQPIQVGLALRAAGQRTGVEIEAALVQHGAGQLAQSDRARAHPPGGEAVEERPQADGDGIIGQFNVVFGRRSFRGGAVFRCL